MSDFTSLGLAANPFDIATDPSLMADREAELHDIDRSLRAAFDAHSSRFILLLGDYGLGKTHMLAWLYSKLTRSDDTGGRVLPALITRAQPGGVLYERPLAIMESEPRWSKFGLSLISRILTALEPDKFAEVLGHLDEDRFSGRYAKLFLALRGKSELAFQYLNGDPLTTPELRELGVRSRLGDSPTGLTIYYEWLSYVAIAGYHTFLLLIDEVEYIAVQSDAKVSQILNTFREMFDRGAVSPKNDPTKAAKSVFLLAISPGGWDRLKQLEAASLRTTGGAGIAPFMERVSPRDRITLRPFSIDDTRELLKLRLARARLATHPDDLSPFADDAIRYIHEAAFRKPRNVIQYCGIILEDALEQGLTTITRQEAKRILSAYGIQAPAPEAPGTT
jgi:hypothetical protein